MKVIDTIKSIFRKTPPPAKGGGNVRMAYYGVAVVAFAVVLRDRVRMNRRAQAAEMAGATLASTLAEVSGTLSAVKTAAENLDARVGAATATAAQATVRAETAIHSAIKAEARAAEAAADLSALKKEIHTYVDIKEGKVS